MHMAYWGSFLFDRFSVAFFIKFVTESDITNLAKSETPNRERSPSRTFSPINEVKDG